MMEQIINLENILADVKRTKSLVNILEGHFMVKREKENRNIDWYSLQYLFEEYGDLNNAIEDKLIAIEKSLSDVVDVLFNIEKNKRQECDSLCR